MVVISGRWDNRWFYFFFVCLIVLPDISKMNMYYLWSEKVKKQWGEKKGAGNKVSDFFEAKKSSFFISILYSKCTQDKQNTRKKLTWKNVQLHC